MSSAHAGEGAVPVAGPDETREGDLAILLESEVAQSVERSRILVKEVTALTGVSRERLRTWERRHGFPTPQHLRSGVRTYAMSDIPLIVAATRLIDAGYPVGDAIATVLDPPKDAAAVDVDGTSLDRAPLPALALALSKTGQLRVAWANLATRLQPGSLGEETAQAAAGERLGPQAIETITAILHGEEMPQAQVLEHLDWVGTFPVTCRSLCWRVDREGAAAVVLLQIPQPSGGEVTGVVDRDAARWATAIGAARGVLQQRDGLVSAQLALRELVERLRAVDGLMVLRQRDGARSASSVRGLVSARAVAPAAFEGLWSAGETGGDIRWLGPSGAEAFGLASYLKLLAVPLGIGGTPLGAAVLCFSEEGLAPDSVRELLQGFGVALAAAVQRDRALALEHRA